MALHSVQGNSTRYTLSIEKSADDVDAEYVFLKVDNAIAVRDARITQIIENPFRYIVNGHMDLRGGGAMRPSWK
jgi:hypothetical protein